MDARSEAELVDRLHREGSILMRAGPASSRSGILELLSSEIGRASGLRRQELANFTRELAIMLDAGQDLDRALRFVVETAPNARVGRVTEQLRNAVRDGSSLASALAKHPKSFPPLFVGMVRAGEAGGRLAPTLDRLAELLENQRRLAATVKSAMIYPALLTVAAIGSITLMLTEVLPQFVPLFEQSGAKLPSSTRAFIEAGDFLTNYGLFILLGVVGLFLALRQVLRQPGVRLLLDRLVLRLPVAGNLVREVLAARFTRTIGTLIQNGVALIPALSMVRDPLGNLAAREAVDDAIASAKSGVGLTRTLAKSGVFPARTTHLLRLGEENAQLGAMALRAAEIHEEKTRISVQRLVSLLVPAITIIMGVAVAGIIASLLTAMLSLNDIAQ
jgi:general secretion pathway protein F